MEDIYFKYRKKILNKFPFLRYLKKYKIIIPKFKALILWKIFKPKKIEYFGKIFYTSIKTFSDPSRNLYAYRDHYETDERNIIEKNISEGDNCIDIGANIGFYTWWFLNCSCTFFAALKSTLLINAVAIKVCCVFHNLF